MYIYFREIAYFTKNYCLRINLFIQVVFIFSVGCTYKDNVMEIADNDFYLSGKQEVLLDGEYMVLKYVANDTDSFELIFKKA